MNITLIGAGALGSHVVLLLRNIDATIKVIDFDVVESKNLMSQFHTKMGLRKNKALALKQSLRGLFQAGIEAVPHKLTEDNVEQLLSGADLLIDCVDNAPTRKLIQDYAKSNDVPCLHAALAAGGVFGQVAWTGHFEVEDAGGATQPTCEDGEALPFLCLVSTYTALAVQNFINGKSPRNCNISPSGIFWF